MRRARVSAVRRQNVSRRDDWRTHRASAQAEGIDSARSHAALQQLEKMAAAHDNTPDGYGMGEGPATPEAAITVQTGDRPASRGGLAEALDANRLTGIVRGGDR